MNSRPLDSPYNRTLKRILDVTISLPVVAVHLLLMPWIGAAIRLTSRGSVIFRQKRVGKDGDEFVMYKFRTMNTDHHISKEDALAGIGDITEGGDGRITPIGQWLRRTGVDELPQFLNVLIGDMSIVGPRPHMISEDRELEEKLDRYTSRRRVKPGITGWAQVNGYRGGTRDMALMQKRTDHDIWYTENWSLRLDVKIIVATFWEVIRAAVDSH